MCKVLTACAFDFVLPLRRCVTGTPFTDSLFELYGQLAFLGLIGGADVGRRGARPRNPALFLCAPANASHTRARCLLCLNIPSFPVLARAVSPGVQSAQAWGASLVASWVRSAHLRSHKCVHTNAVLSFFLCLHFVLSFCATGHARYPGAALPRRVQQLLPLGVQLYRRGRGHNPQARHNNNDSSPALCSLPCSPPRHTEAHALILHACSRVHRSRSVRAPPVGWLHLRSRPDVSSRCASVYARALRSCASNMSSCVVL